MTTSTLELALDPKSRTFPPFSLVNLLGTVFEPTDGCSVCILTDLDDPANETKIK